MARRFRFRLEALLRLRRLREREALRIVGAAQADLARSEQLIAQTESEIRRQQDALRREQGGGNPEGSVHVVTVIRGQAWIAHLRRMCLQQQQVRADATVRLAQARQALAAARTRTRIVEKLRERRLSEFRSETVRREDALLDDVARRMQRAAITAQEPHRLLDDAR